MELVRLERAEIGYGRTALVPPFDFNLNEGDRVAVLGPNGGGKTTLLRTLIGLLPLVGGRRVVRSERLHVGYVPQAHRADPAFPLSAYQVVLQGRYGRVGLFRFPSKADKQLARLQLERVGLADKADQPFYRLSGGQRQRVLLARALAGEPQLLALDEFTSELDPAASAALQAEVSQLTASSKVALIFVTHEIAAAATHASRVVLIDSRRSVVDCGEADSLLVADRLTRLYGQPVHLERRDGRIVVTVETGAAP